jgi:hypothetical protein
MAHPASALDEAPEPTIGAQAKDDPLWPEHTAEDGAPRSNDAMGVRAQTWCFSLTVVEESVRALIDHSKHRSVDGAYLFHTHPSDVHCGSPAGWRDHCREIVIEDGAVASDSWAPEEDEAK